MKAYLYSMALVGASLLGLLSGCIKEDTVECKRELIVSFYSKTPCRPDTVYTMEATHLMLSVFDENELLVTSLRRNSFSSAKGYTEKIQLPGGGNYSVVAWTGLDGTYYDLNELQVGATKKSDLLFRLKRVQEQARSIDGAQLYAGNSPSVFVEESDSESTFAEVGVNLLEVTNRVSLSVSGLSGSPDDYEAYIRSDHGSMNLNGTLAPDETLRHDPVERSDPNRLSVAFTLLKFDPDHVYTLVIRNTLTGEEFFRDNLLTSLILKVPGVNLNCDHDFEVEVVIGGGGTSGSVEVWVNGWLVHSYDTEM